MQMITVDHKLLVLSGQINGFCMHCVSESLLRFLN